MASTLESRYSRNGGAVLYGGLGDRLVRLAQQVADHAVGPVPLDAQAGRRDVFGGLAGGFGLRIRPIYGPRGSAVRPSYGGRAELESYRRLVPNWKKSAPRVEIEVRVVHTMLYHIHLGTHASIRGARVVLPHLFALCGRRASTLACATSRTGSMSGPGPVSSAPYSMPCRTYGVCFHPPTRQLYSSPQVISYVNYLTTCPWGPRLFRLQRTPFCHWKTCSHTLRPRERTTLVGVVLTGCSIHLCSLAHTHSRIFVVHYRNQPTPEPPLNELNSTICLPSGTVILPKAIMYMAQIK